MRIDTVVGPIRISAAGCQDVPVKFATKRREYRLFEWHFATVYEQDLDFGKGDVVRSHWLFFGPKNFGLGLVLPWR